MVDSTRIHFWHYILNDEGEPLQNVEVRFYLNDDPTVEANIFSTEYSSSYTKTSSANIKTDSNGYFEFWIANEWETGGYERTQEFRLEWYRAGIKPGVLKNINPWPNIFSWENKNTGGDKEDRNKFISNFYANKWYTHVNKIVPSASPHDLQKVDYQSGCDNNRYNKVVSNKFLNDIYTLSGPLSSANLSAANVYEYKEDVTSWSTSSGIFYKDIVHSGITSRNVTVQLVELSNGEEISPKRITKISPSATRIFLESELDINVNIQGSSSSSSSSSSISSSSSSTSSSSTSSA